MNFRELQELSTAYNKVHESQEIEELYKGKHGQSDKEYADSRSQGGKMVSGDSKQSGAEYTHGRRVKAANPGMQPDVGGKTKPKSQGKMDAGTRADLEYRKANLKKEEVEIEEGIVDTLKSAAKGAKKGVETARKFQQAPYKAVDRMQRMTRHKQDKYGPSTLKQRVKHGGVDYNIDNERKAKMKTEEASMSPQEVALQKKKAMIDKMIAAKRMQGLKKSAPEKEAPTKAMGEETEDSLRDRRMERGGVGGNQRYDKAPKFAPGPSKKKYDGMSAVDAVKADIRAKYGKGAIIDKKKK